MEGGREELLQCSRNNTNNESNDAEIRVSLFDTSIDNHFKAIDTISKLCGENNISYDEAEIQCLSSSITFLREWRHYNCQPKTVRFACEVEDSKEKDILGEVLLPQFSSVAVPKKEELYRSNAASNSSKDFVMHVGGSVWALDWCPRADERPAGPIKCEYVAVAAHPFDSYYHKIGASLTGRGVVQIWCILNNSGDGEETPDPGKKSKHGIQNKDACSEKSIFVKPSKGRPRKKQIDGSPISEAKNQIKRPRGRPRKKQIEESLNDEAVMENSTQFKRSRGRPRNKGNDDSVDHLGSNSQHIQVLSVKYPEDSTQLLAIEAVSENTQEQTIPKNGGKKRKSSSGHLSTCNSIAQTSGHSRRLKSSAKAASKGAGIPCSLVLAPDEHDQSFIMNHQIHQNCIEDPPVLNCDLDNVSGNINTDSSIPVDVALPRLMFCLAHNGKVAWDAKWRPCLEFNSKCNHRMGYLAVLLGNGILEVWDIPLPHVTKVVYSSFHIEGTDPRFVKLEPVFRGSISKHREMQSIPLTVEWSTSYPHDFLLAGCHDGTVALWKFSVRGSSGDTRPLLCFSADTVPIRAVAWAPVESDKESANVILTGGHGGLKFWDIRYKKPDRVGRYEVLVWNLFVFVSLYSIRHIKVLTSDPFRPLWDLHPAPKFIYSLDWPPDPSCIMLSFDDGTMRLLSLVKAAHDAHVYGKPSVGPKQQGLHVLFNFSSFAVWSLQVSRKTGMVAYCSADGSVCRFQLTRKAVEKDPSRNRTPHFMVGSLSKDDAAITVNIPLPDTPVTLKKPVNNVGDNPRSMKSLLESSLTKRANNKAAKAPASDQLLALCYGNDPGMQSESDETLASFEAQTKSKSKNISKKTGGDDIALVCIDGSHDGRRQKENEKVEAAREVEVIPPKIIAMHRVRWNVNKGSERWLCSGGAAGIVRCQEIKLSDMDEHLARKQ